MSRLAWPDLIIESITPERCSDWLAPWTGIASGRVAPVFLNKFGSWFLRRSEGHVEMLDVFTGQLQRIAESYTGFIQEVNEQWWQEFYLHSELVWQLHESDKIPGLGQCYAIAPHPALGGPNPDNGEVVDSKDIIVMDVVVWQSLCAQMLGVGQ
ncbi:MAG: hypothetical protein JWM11_4317 [Planctomycetaceae bacterium]|nr:hypothetical protein [Planctomycetaceae bacterium]